MTRDENEQAWTEFLWAVLFDAHTSQERDGAARWRIMMNQRSRLAAMVKNMFDAFELAIQAQGEAPTPQTPAMTSERKIDQMHEWMAAWQQRSKDRAAQKTTDLKPFRPKETSA